MSEYVTYQQVTLDKIRVAAQRRIQPELFEHYRIDAWEDKLAQELVVGIDRWVWGGEVKQHSVSWPADWWQHLKHQHAPGWFRRRWPVRYTVHAWSIKALYPDLRPSLIRERYTFMASELPRYEQTGKTR